MRWWLDKLRRDWAGRYIPGYWSRHGIRIHGHWVYPAWVQAVRAVLITLATIVVLGGLVLEIARPDIIAAWGAPLR